jgi:hypothetical protein
VDEDNREKIISDVIEIESYTKFTFPGEEKNILILNGISPASAGRLCRRNGFPYLQNTV